MVDLLLQAAEAPSPAGPAQQAPGEDPFGFLRSMLVPLVAMIAIFWLLVWRPESRKRKEREILIKNVKKGDTVVTTGGIIGKVWRADSPGEVVLVIDKDKDVKARFSRSAVFEVLKADIAATSHTSQAPEPGGEAEERAKSAESSR
jgi:preprotein translocase subunit YajC